MPPLMAYIYTLEHVGLTRFQTCHSPDLETFGVQLVDVINHALHQALEGRPLWCIVLGWQDGVEEPCSVGVPLVASD